MDIAAFIMVVSIVGTVAGLFSSFVQWRLESSVYGQPTQARAVTLPVAATNERFDVEMSAAA
jgi:hypothetical protein